MRRLAVGGAVAVLLLTLLPASPAAGRVEAGEEREEIVLVFPQPYTHTGFSNTWGAARPGGRRHRGTDLMGRKGDPVLAVADGIVEKITTGGPRSGFYLVIRHPGGWKSWYMHLNNDTEGTDDGDGGLWEVAIADGLQVGDPVRAGQVVAYVGDSGNAEGTSPHTHFELHYRGKAVNPYPYLKAAWDRWQLETAIESGETRFK